MSKRSEAREQFLREILTTAVEGGINYWSAVDRVERHEDDGIPWVQSLRVWVIGDGDCHVCPDEARPATEEEIQAERNGDDTDLFVMFPGAYLGITEPTVHGCRGHRVDTDTIAHGFTVVGDVKGRPDIALHPSYRSQYAGVSRTYAADDWDLDAGDADNILQAGLFDRCVFG